MLARLRAKELSYGWLFGSHEGVKFHNLRHEKVRWVQNIYCEVLQENFVVISEKLVGTLGIGGNVKGPVPGKPVFVGWDVG